MKNLYNMREVAEYFNITRKTVYSWVKQGRLPRPINRAGSPRWDTTQMVETFKNWRKPTEEESEENNSHAA